MVGLIVAILVSAAVINGGDNGTDEFIARQAWLYVSILGAGYFISRGLAKSGSREPYTPTRPTRSSTAASTPASIGSRCSSSPSGRAGRRRSASCPAAW